MKHETHRISDPRIPFIFHRMHHRQDHHACRCNWHENPEFWLITNGNGIIQNDEVQIPVKAGDIAAINANSLHGIQTETPLKYLCLIIDRSFLLANGVDSNELRFDLRIRDPEIGQLIRQFEQEYFAPESKPFRITAMRSYALQITTLLCRRHSHSETQKHCDSRMLSAIKQAIGLIRTESDKNLSLDEIAKFIGFSKYYFAREFHRITGYSVFSYLNLIRCEKAKSLLAKKGLSIGEIGALCGFSNQSYFTRMFRTYEGTTPSQYRERYASSGK